MNTFARIPPVLVRSIAAVFALAGCYLLGTGLYDLLIDHDTANLFTKGRAIIISQQSNPEHFHNLVCYRLELGVVMLAPAYVLDRLHRWWRTNE